MSFGWATGSEQCVQVDLALPQHLGNLTSIPSFSSRLLCVTLETLFYLFWSSLSLQEETSVCESLSCNLAIPLLLPLLSESQYSCHW